jgi:hypothetical protein
MKNLKASPGRKTVASRWSAAGGHIPTSRKGREKWGTQVSAGSAALSVSIMKSVWVVVEIPVQACGGSQRVWGASTPRGSSFGRSCCAQHDRGVGFPGRRWLRGASLASSFNQKFTGHSPF